MNIKQIIAGLLVTGAVLWVAADDGPSRDFIYVDAASGNDYWERGSYEEPFGTLQYAIEHSVSNSVIFVRAGSYGEVELSDHPVRLIALDGALQTTLEHCTVRAEAGGSAVAGFTITGGYGVTVRDEWDNEIMVGGGLYAEGSLTVSDCVLRENGSYNVERGGALYATGTNVTVLISNCLIKDNEANEGPAVYLANSSDEESGCNSLILRNCTVYGNRDNWNDGGVSAVAFIDGCSITIDRSILSDNWHYQIGCVDGGWNYPPVEISHSYVQDEESGCNANLDDSDGLIRTSPEFFSNGEYDFGLSVNDSEYEGVGCDFHAFEAPPAVDESDYDYEIQESGGVVIVKASSNVVGHVALPSMLGGRPVVGIRGEDKRVFLRADAVESIILPRYCVEISEYAFAECSALKELEIPEGIVIIGDEVVSHCNSLGRISLPRSLRKIGRYAFRWCEKCYFEIPDENPYFSTDAVGCLYDKEKKILLRLSGGGDSTTLHIMLWGNGWNLPQGLECIANGAATGYGDTEWETYFTIPATVTNIAYDAFGDCRGVCAFVDSANPNYATNDREAIFSKDYGTLFNYRGSGHYTIPSSVTNIAYWAFAYNRTITSAAIPDSVASVGEYAFFRCTGLRSVVLSRNVEVWNTVFAECDVLERVDFPAGCKAKYLYNWLFEGCTNLSSAILSEGIEYIGFMVFNHCSKLPELTVPESVKTFVPGRLLSLTNFQFRGLPPGNGSAYGSSAIDAPLATGYYRPKYATEWESVIKSDGTWRGIPMECRPMTNVVRFVMGDHVKRTGGGALVQSVLDCTDAVAPELSVSRGWRFAGWDVAFTNINSDVTVCAVCEPFIGDPNEAAGLSGPSNTFSYVGIYDGVAHGISVALEDPPEGLAVRYATEVAGPFSENAILFRDVCTETPVWYELSAPGFAPVTNWATVTITAKPLAVTAQATGKVFGTADPVLPYSAVGLVGADALTGALTRAPGEAVGTYAILQGTLAAGPNYALDFTGATFTISQTPIIGPFEPAEPDIDPETGLVIIRILGDQGPIEIPDNLGPFILDLNGHSITGVCGSAESGNYDGGPAIIFTHVEYGEGTSVIVRNSDPQGRGGIFGGDGANGTAAHPAGGNGGPGILIEDAAVAPSVTIEENVLVRGGRGGNGYAGSGADGGNGGAGIEDRTTEPDDSTIVNGGTIEGGDGGNGADGTGDTPGGNGGNGGAGVDGDVDDNTGTITGGDGGDGGDSESGNGGKGGDGGDGVGGDVGTNEGTITGGDGGEGGDSGSGDGGGGGSGGEGVGGDVDDNTGTITDGEDGTTVLTATMVSLDGEPWIYVGRPIEPTVTVTSGSAVLVKDVDYTVAYENNVVVGTATVVVTGVGNCEGMVTQTFDIGPKPLTDEMVQPGEDAFFYDGNEKKPTVEVMHEVGGRNLCTTNDYTLVYGEKADAGWWVTVTGKGNYTGTVTKIVPVLKRPLAPPVVPTRAYNGKTQKPTIPTDSRWTVVANPGGIDVGEYTNVVLRLTDPVNYKWKGGTEEDTDVTLVFAVTKANNGWSRTPAMTGWEYGQTPSEPNFGQARYGTVQVAYRKAGADVSTETATRPELPGQYIARFWVDETESYYGVATKSPYKDVAFEITGTAPDDPVDPPPELPEEVTALISMAADGTPEISWTPDLSDNPRIVYTVLGKEKLSDAEWTPVTGANKPQMRFFKVRVEAK